MKTEIRNPAVGADRAEAPQMRSLFATVVLLILLTGCASPGVGGSADSHQSEYNTQTGYPAVGTHPWLLD